MTETVTETATETIRIRPARTGDVGAIKTLVAPLADQRILMAKETVAYYESLQEFRIAESEDGEVIGCGALHVMWEDLAEVRTLAASDAWRGKGVGHALVERLLEDARGAGRLPGLLPDVRGGLLQEARL